MKYRNTVTGAIIDVNAEISGKDWEKVSPSQKPPAQDREVAPAQPKRKARGKKSE